MRLVELPLAIRWHVVNRNVHPGFTVREKISEKITALSKLLVHFPPDSVHFQVVLDKLAKKGLYEVRLTLRLPSNILHAEKTGTDLLVTINTAFQALKREVMSLKAELRGDYRWKRPARRAELKAAKETRLALPPVTDGAFAMDPDLVAELFAVHHASLLAHAGRVLRMAELTGDLPLRALEAGDVVDEVARVVLDPLGAISKPARMSHQQWFFQLVQEEVKRQVRRFVEEMRLRTAPDIGVNLLPEEEETHEAGLSLSSWLEGIGRSEESLPEERFADVEAIPPDAAIAGKELVNCLQQEVKTWPALERQIFELHYLVGLEVGDVAMIIHQPQAETKAVIERTQLRLRAFLGRAVSIEPPDR